MIGGLWTRIARARRGIRFINSVHIRYLSKLCWKTLSDLQTPEGENKIEESGALIWRPVNRAMSGSAVVEPGQEQGEHTNLISGFLKILQLTLNT